MQISIAIATMRRWTFLKSMLPIFLSRSEVSEVVLCDETGEDADAATEAFGTNPKLKIYRNEKRLGIYENKCKALSLAQGPWVAVLDSDNVFPEEWFECIKDLDSSDPLRIYGSADFKTLNMESGQIHTPCIQFSGVSLNKDSWNNFLHKERSYFLLNDGNWILHKNASSFLPPITSESILAVDAIFILWVLIKNGFTINYPTGLEYIHLVHPGSSWIQSEKASLKILLENDWRV
jgi:glycosyltransferase involved in cell wall biosynthesis